MAQFECPRHPIPSASLWLGEFHFLIFLGEMEFSRPEWDRVFFSALGIQTGRNNVNVCIKPLIFKPNLTSALDCRISLKIWLLAFSSFEWTQGAYGRIYRDRLKGLYVVGSSLNLGELTQSKDRGGGARGTDRQRKGERGARSPNFRLSQNPIELTPWTFCQS